MSDITGRNLQPHQSHDMTDWKSTIVTLTETSRFGEVRRCTACGCEHVRTAAGEVMNSELSEECV